MLRRRNRTQSAASESLQLETQLYLGGVDAGGAIDLYTTSGDVAPSSNGDGTADIVLDTGEECLLVYLIGTDTEAIEYLEHIVLCTILSASGTHRVQAGLYFDETASDIATFGITAAGSPGTGYAGTGFVIGGARENDGSNDRYIAGYYLGSLDTATFNSVTTEMRISGEWCPQKSPTISGRAIGKAMSRYASPVLGTVVRERNANPFTVPNVFNFAYAVIRFEAISAPASYRLERAQINLAGYTP